jgi:hypothetical protein
MIFIEGAADRAILLPQTRHPYFFLVRKLTVESLLAEMLD